MAVVAVVPLFSKISTRVVCGHPLFVWQLAVLRRCKTLTKIVVTTPDVKMANDYWAMFKQPSEIGFLAIQANSEEEQGSAMDALYASAHEYKGHQVSLWELANFMRPELIDALVASLEKAHLAYLCRPVAAMGEGGRVALPDGVVYSIGAAVAYHEDVVSRRTATGEAKAFIRTRPLENEAITLDPTCTLLDLFDLMIRGGFIEPMEEGVERLEPEVKKSLEDLDLDTRMTALLGEVGPVEDGEDDEPIGGIL